VMAWLVAALAAAYHAFVNYFTGMGAAAYQLYAAVAGAIGAIMGWFAALPGRIAAAVVSFGSLLYGAGRDLIQGLINGVGSMIGAAASAVRNVGSSIVGSLKGVLGIHSPSTVFAEMGQNIGEGLVQGVNSMQGKANMAISGLVGGSGVISTNGSLPASPTSSSTRIDQSHSSSSQITIQQLVIQAPNNATLKTIFDSLNQDTLNVSRGLTPVQGSY
jgi:phage-related protein